MSDNDKPDFLDEEIAKRIAKDPEFLGMIQKEEVKRGIECACYHNGFSMVIRDCELHKWENREPFLNSCSAKAKQPAGSAKANTPHEVAMKDLIPKSEKADHERRAKNLIEDNNEQ